MRTNDYDCLACTVLCHQDVGIVPRKGLLGLLGFPGQMCYLPTCSQVIHRDEGYTKQSLDAINELLQSGGFSNAQPITPDMNGNILVKMYYSKDHMFLAMQICQYVDFEYRQISPAYVFTGQRAEEIINGLL